MGGGFEETRHLGWRIESRWKCVWILVVCVRYSYKTTNVMEKMGGDQGIVCVYGSFVREFEGLLPRAGFQKSFFSFLLQLSLIVWMHSIYFLDIKYD